MHGVLRERVTAATGLEKKVSDLRELLPSLRVGVLGHKSQLLCIIYRDKQKWAAR